ncbi:hypothetical protein [Scytonema sp. NUACC26]
MINAQYLSVIHWSGGHWSGGHWSGGYWSGGHWSLVNVIIESQLGNL